jgi:hypothetical protein
MDQTKQNHDMYVCFTSNVPLFATYANQRCRLSNTKLVVTKYPLVFTINIIHWIPIQLYAYNLMKQKYPHQETNNSSRTQWDHLT